ncbi:demethylmenaquinone methyltransferase/2-methoxy-6-polyprenyl-1,4-benzoquinol methylase [Hydrogenispora ethanolica]|jgi:demethylmenaquinone methyltransferase/2-methoxy-6-polyprenyl-1,4-benzoquinol methylase|uniref:Demethylmenaquinone methyltransferase n=1 Tax=Hydrogenispora ethanolica TaxID=1082276 RepID=A0A4R1RV63_HYDET|nr:bifunctional demethylmenaquinone methyltransferase/2-methoxy-6-polyprenyl-1,4-benzoquinol methylase UbiE [Hydrogenispora ethanolica]TCL69990.1 demethylmenaquinone methyltransferase/2-methoxy-6-polyprenyl-1,4-benzoquinol methylase [Hydrogenispora ethanolica]
MISKEQQVMGIFNSIAPRYDLVNTIVSFGWHHFWRRFAVAQAHLRSGDSVLDLCCGTGALTAAAAKKVAPFGQVVGLDFSEKMLEVARRRVHSFRFRDNIRFIRGNALDLPFPDNRFDCVTVAYGLRNVTDPARVLKEARRVLKPTGTVVSLDLGKPSAPVFKNIYYFYLNHWIPLTGGVFTKSPTSYRYLHDSILEFPHQKEISTLYRRLGFKNIQCSELTWGIAMVHTAQK